MIDWAAKKEATDRDSESKASTAHSSPTSPIKESSSVIHPDGMKHWWGKYNLRSLDGLPAFSLGMGLGFKFEVNFQRLLQGMRGDISGSQAAVTRNADSSHRVTDSNALRLSSPTDRNFVPKMINSNPNLIFETSLSQVLQSYRFRIKDFPSLVSALLPLLIAFILGLLLGQMYDKHTFPLSGAARLHSHISMDGI